MIRPFKASDTNMVLSAWAHSFYRSHAAGPLSWPIYYQAYASQIQLLLNSCITLVACNPEDEEQIFGFLCYEPTVSVIVRGAEIKCPAIHYLYTKRIFHHYGVAKELLTAAGLLKQAYVACTFSTPDGTALAKALDIKTIFNPTVARRFRSGA